MRTTVTLDPDAEALVRKLMRERGLTFKQAVNEAIRTGLGGGRAKEPYRQETFAMGQPAVPLVKALAVASELEDDERIRKMDVGK